MSTIAFAEQMLVLAALVAAIWSAIAFVRNVYRQREEARAIELQRWRKASVQEMLHRSEHFITVEEITHQLRSASFDTNLRVEKHELTAAEVRVLLIEMLEAKVIEQLWGDRYGIAKRDPVIEKASLELRQNEIIRNVFDLITLAPSQLTTDAIMKRLGEDKYLRESDFLIAIHELVHRKIAEIDENGRWLPLYPARLETSGVVEVPLSLPENVQEV